MDYTAILTEIKNLLLSNNLNVVGSSNVDGIYQKLDKLILILSNPQGTGILEVQNQMLAKLSSSNLTSSSITDVPDAIDYTNVLNQILVKLTSLETIALWVVGIGTAAIIFYMLYRFLNNFIDF